MRLDKYLCDMQCGTRSEIKELIRKGHVTVNGEVIKKPETKVDDSTDKVLLDGNPVKYVEYEYYMLNKPQGVLSAARDPKAKTVVDLITEKNRKDLFPVGRLDKDTEGLLIITNDGQLTHNLLSPKKHIPKTYYAITDGIIEDDAIELFKCGLTLSDGTVCKSASLNILERKEGKTYLELTIYEGKFHQVKRMTEAVGATVIYLKRLSMGDLLLDENLKLSEYRKLTEKELAILRGEACE